MTRRQLSDRAELARHLEWLRTAVHDRNVDVRLVVEGLLDALETAVEMIPGPRP